MEQKDLFSRFTEKLVDRPLARTGDPATSHQAAAAIVDEGKLGNMQRRVLKLIRDYPGLTGSELDEIPQGRRGQAHKRTRELLRMGLIRVGETRTCTVSGRPAKTYLPTKEKNDEC